MKILKIIGIVAGIHALFFLVVFANPGCSSTSKPQTAAAEPVKDTPPPAISLASYGAPAAPITASPIEQDTAAAPAFNPDAPATGGAIRYSPTRPNTTAAAALETAPVADVTPASTYTVAKGDSLWTIAKKNHLPVADLAGANNLRPSATLHLGQKLVIPSKAGATAQTGTEAVAPASAPAAVSSGAPATAPSEGGQTYTVKNGETLGQIAHRFHLSSGALGAANNITDPRLIRPGQVLTIPAKGQTTTKSRAVAHAPAAAPVAAPAPIQTIPTSTTPAEQDLDAGLKPASTGEVPVIKVEDGSSAAPKN
jgi:LysM repeat protein